MPILVNKDKIRVGHRVRRGSEPIGVLNIESPSVGAFSQDDEYLRLQQSYTPYPKSY